MTKRKTKLGNAGCTQCGLRASSKNVMCRSVFPCWPDEDHIIRMMEGMVRMHNHKGIEYIRIISYDEQAPATAMGLWFKTVYDHNPAKYDGNLKKLLCYHTWKQDRGTSTV